MDSLSKYDVIIFDCDGVIMDVNLSKCEAFGIAVKGYPDELINDFVDYCKNTFGVSRYVKFKEFFSEFAKEPFQEYKYKLFLNNYADECKKAYQKTSTTQGFKELLTKINSTNKKAYVASGSDEKELIEVFEKKKISRYFKGIYGSPATKVENTSKILLENPDAKAVFIGDALSDMETAKKYGLDFIYMNKYTVQSIEQDRACRQVAIKVINSLKDLV
jgi:HAD superfamily hydrolase (TIGR01549 family)